MATKKKLNVKFLAIVLGTLAVGIAVVGGIVLVQYRNDPVKHITKGDELMAEGLPDKAVQQYLRGIGKAPFEMAYYDKAIAAIESIKPETDFERMEEYNRLLGVLISKAEKASPQDGKTAEAVREEVLDRVLDESRVFVFGRESAPLPDRDRAYSSLARRFQMLDGAMARTPGVDPRLAAAVRGVTLEAAWRAAPLQTESQWEGSVKRLRDAIEIDPTYVPNWYGLLRGQLDRFERTLIETGSRAAARLLQGDEGLLATLQQAREAVGDAPAPELDMIEAELGQVALFAGAAGDGPEDLVPVPDAEGIAGVLDTLPVIERLPGWEARWRLEELRAAALGVLRRTPSARTDATAIAAYRDGSIGLMSGVVDSFVAIAPDDARTAALRLGSILSSQDEASQARMAEAIRAARALKADEIGLNALMATTLAQQAALKDFDLAIAPGVEANRERRPFDPEIRERATAAMQAVEDAFRDDTTEDVPSAVLRCRLIHATFLGIDAALRGDEDAARELFNTGGRAANQLRLSEDAVLDGRTLDAALILAETRGEFGEALSLLNSTIERSPEIAEDLDIRVRILSLLARSGRVEDARAMIPDLRARAAAESNTIVLARIDEIESNITRIVEGVDLTEVKGADLLAAETEASLRGDIDERRRLLEQVIQDDEVLPEIRAKALLRRAGIEAQAGDFGLARQFAGRVLDLDPDNPMAMLIMASDADTGIIDRFRILAGNAAVDDQGRDVALAGMIRGQLLANTVIAAEERAALEAELDRLLTSLAAEPEPGVDTIRFLADVALSEGRVAEATVLAERLDRIEDDPTSLSVLLRARILQESGDPDAAIALVRDAIESKGLGTDGMYVLLGELLAFRGDREGSRDAYQQAFELAPSRPLNALRLATALLAEGRGQEALPVLRAARSAGRESTQFLDRWLLQEMRAGNFDTAIRERRRRYEFAPIDFRNAIALVQLLAESPIGRTDVVWSPDEAAGRRDATAGEPRYDEAGWARLSTADRQTLILEARARRQAEAAAIIERMLELDGTDPQVVTAASAFLRSRPDEASVARADELVEAAVTTLRSSLEDDLDDAARLRTEIRLSRVLVVQAEQALAAGDRERAAELIDEAVAIEGDRTSDVDTLAASLYIRNQMLAEAVPHQQRLLAEREAAGIPMIERREIARRLVEILVGVNDVAAATPIVDRYFRGDDPSASDLVSLGAYTFGRADDARRNRTGESDRRFLELLDEADDYYARAAALRADDPTIDYPRLKIAEYRWRWSDDADRPALYADLRDYATGFVARHADSWVARRGLVDVLRVRDGGDGSEEDTVDRRFKEATAQLREFLEIDPSHVEARLFLIDALAAAGEQRQALDVAQAALDRDPSNRLWAGRVGRLRTELREFDEAARQFGMLFEQTGDESFLQMQVMALMELDPPRADAVIGLARANGRIFAQRPFLGGMYSAAMAQSGRRDLALRNFESLYAKVRQAAAESGSAVAMRNMSNLAAALPKLFPSDEQGARDLEAYVDTISGGNPSVPDLLSVASVWQRISESTDRSDADDDSLRETADQATIALLQRATTADPSHPDTSSAYLRLGVMLQRVGECPAAIESFERAVELQPDSPQAMNNLAYLLLECDGDLDRALALSSAAVERLPSSPENRDTLGGILMALAVRASDAEDRTALLQQARDQLRQATRLGNSPAAWIRLAELELMSDRPDEARSALLRAGDLDPDPDQQAQLDALTERLRTAG